VTEADRQLRKASHKFFFVEEGPNLPEILRIEDEAETRIRGVRGVLRKQVVDFLACAAAKAITLVESVADDTRAEVRDARLLFRRLPLRDLVGISREKVDEKPCFQDVPDPVKSLLVIARQGELHRRTRSIEQAEAEQLEGQFIIGLMFVIVGERVDHVHRFADELEMIASVCAHIDRC
jgi:hypothetical protein